MSADRFEEHNAKRRIGNPEEPLLVQLWRLASKEPQFLLRDQKPEVAPDSRAGIDPKAVAFLQAMHDAARPLRLSGYAAVASADRMGIHGERIGQLAELVDHNPKKGLALLQAAALAITVPRDQQHNYPGMVTSIGKAELEDYFKEVDAAAAAKRDKKPNVPPVRPIAVDGIIQALGRRYPGYGDLARP